MLKTLFFAIAEEVATASACAALVRAGGHRARAVDATLLTKADREPADLVFTSEAAAANVHAAYDDKPVIVIAAFNPAEFLPERMRAAEAWVHGEGEQPEFDAAAKPAKTADATGGGKVTAAELKAALDAKGIAYRGNASKAELQALLDGANTQT